MPLPSAVRRLEMPDLCARCGTLDPTRTHTVFSQPERHFGDEPPKAYVARQQGMTVHVRRPAGLGLMGAVLGMWDVSYSLAVPVCTKCEWKIAAGHSNALWVAIGVGVVVAAGVGVAAVSALGLAPATLFTPVACGVPPAVLTYFLWRWRGGGYLAWIRKGGRGVTFAHREFNARFHELNGGR